MTIQLLWEFEPKEGKHGNEITVSTSIKCAYGGKFDLQHGFSCKTFDFISIRHNQII